MSVRRITCIALPRDVREERHLAGALDRARDLVLVPAARSGDAARADLALLRDVPAQRARVLVVDVLDLRLAELAALAADRAALVAGPLAAALAVLGLLSHRPSFLERDVVVGRREVVGRGRRRARRHVLVAATAGEAALALAAAAEELDGVGDDLDGLALRAVLRVPLAPLEASVDADRAALREVLRAILALLAPDGDVE